jgi:hypothetical protein
MRSGGDHGHGDEQVDRIAPGLAPRAARSASVIGDVAVESGRNTETARQLWHLSAQLAGTGTRLTPRQR